MTAPYWLATALFWLALINLAVVLVSFGLLIVGRIRVRQLKNVGLEDLTHWPRISLIAPARNEERIY